MRTSKPVLSGADIFFECLKREKVDVIFGYPCGVVLKLYEKLYDVDFKAYTSAMSRCNSYG
jgi:acetolactate synthase-1/2/3 large subunit